MNNIPAPPPPDFSWLRPTGISKVLGWVWMISIVLLILGLAIAALVWAYGASTGNTGLAAKGKNSIIGILIGAILLLASPALLNALYLFNTK